jgi:U6 snRNA-associated Sm-like protein LSm7
MYFKCDSNIALAVSSSTTDPSDMERITNDTRKLGLVVIRGTQVSLVSPKDGMEEISNPFLAAEE